MLIIIIALDRTFFLSEPFGSGKLAEDKSEMSHFDSFLDISMPTPTGVSYSDLKWNESLANETS